jgi:hypothetical protein
MLSKLYCLVMEDFFKEKSYFWTFNSNQTDWKLEKMSSVGTRVGPGRIELRIKLRIEG